jgi:SAM-dependent methyltransferase
MVSSASAAGGAGKPGKYDSAEFSRAQKTAQERLHPSIWASNYMVLSNRRRRMQRLFQARESVGDVLDVGGQYCPYYPLFKDKCTSYTSMDLIDTPIVDIVCNAEEMPVEDCSYDTVLCTQVLEHCGHPQRIVDECHRVLRPGGTLIVTVPSIFPMHGYPADNWRFMPDGLRLMLKAFGEVEVLGEASFAESLAQVNCLYGHVLMGRLGPLKKVLSPLWNLTTNVLGRGLSWGMQPLIRNNFVAFTTNLWAEARK